MNPKKNLLNLIEELEERVNRLEQENIETTNCLYELHNRLDMMNQSEYTLDSFSLGE